MPSDDPSFPLMEKYVFSLAVNFIYQLGSLNLLIWG